LTHGDTRKSIKLKRFICAGHRQGGTDTTARIQRSSERDQGNRQRKDTNRKSEKESKIGKGGERPLHPSETKREEKTEAITRNNHPQ